MIRTVAHWSREAAEQFSPAPDKAVLISLTDPGSRDVTLQPGWADVLCFKFHDLERAYPPEYPEECLIQKDQAHSIAEFIHRTHLDPRVLALVVHCEAGVSRSRAVACAVRRHYRLPPYSVDHNGNELVYQTVLAHLHAVYPGGITP